MTNKNIIYRAQTPDYQLGWATSLIIYEDGTGTGENGEIVWQSESALPPENAVATLARNNLLSRLSPEGRANLGLEPLPETDQEGETP